MIRSTHLFFSCNFDPRRSSMGGRAGLVRPAGHVPRAAAAWQEASVAGPCGRHHRAAAPPPSAWSSRARARPVRPPPKRRSTRRRPMLAPHAARLRQPVRPPPTRRSIPAGGIHRRSLLAQARTGPCDRLARSAAPRR